MQTTVEAVLNRKGRKVWSLPPTATVHEAVQIMARERIEALVILDGESLVGILTERDCARRVTLHGTNPKDVLVRDVMTTPIVFVGHGHTVGDCLSILSSKGFAHLPVVEQDKVVGIVSMGDLVNSIIRDQDRTIAHLEGYITGSYPA